MNSISDVWQSVLSRLQEQLSETTIRTWFDEVDVVTMEDSAFVLHCSNSFKKSTIETRFMKHIKAALKDIFSSDLEVKILNDEQLAAYHGVAPDQPGSLLDSDAFTFETYVVGPQNKLAYAAARAVADKPAENFNPLFIYGDSGLGKTHLLYAIAHQVKRKREDLRIVYIKGDDFTNELIASIREGSNAEFREKYRQAGILLVDDIQFIAGKKQTQEEFFHTFNTLYESGRQIVLTSDRPPREMTQLEDRLQSRFVSGLMVDVAIHNTFTSVIGSSATTIAGFIALCFMSFTLGRDLGIVMAKGVLLGVLGCVTILPSLILVLDKPLQRTRHKSLIPDMGGFAKSVCKIFPVFLVIFALLVAPAYISYDKTNDEVYYDMGQCLPEDMEYVIANKKLSEEFDIASTHMLLVNADLPDSDVRAMIDEMEQVPGVKYVLGMESVVGPMIPMEVLPDSVRSMLESDQWELLLINSEYKVASDDVDQQIDQLNAILKKYDEGGMLIGEAPCMKDMIETTDHDFKVVNAISIAAIFLIITLVEGSFSLPFILIAVIELAIFINLGLPHVLGQSLPFIAPICISTIQLGATVDYAILMTTRYKAERLNGEDKKKAVMTALRPEDIVHQIALLSDDQLLRGLPLQHL